MGNRTEAPSATQVPAGQTPARQVEPPPPSKTKAAVGAIEGFDAQEAALAPPGEPGMAAAAKPGAAEEGAVPEGAVPEGKVPEGKVPEGAVPEGAVPEGAVPEGAAPEGAAPKAAGPETQSGAKGAPKPAQKEGQRHVWVPGQWQLNGAQYRFVAAHFTTEKGAAAGPKAAPGKAAPSGYGAAKGDPKSAPSGYGAVKGDPKSAGKAKGKLVWVEGHWHFNGAQQVWVEGRWMKQG